MAGKSLRILIVENDILLRVTLEDMVAEMGHTPVGWAATEARAISEADRLRPDAVIMDIDLDEGGDGTKAACLIRDRFDIPSLFATGGAHPDKMERVRAARPLGYLLKPVRFKDLRVHLLRSTSDSASREETTTVPHGAGMDLTDWPASTQVVPTAAPTK